MGRDTGGGSLPSCFEVSTAIWLSVPFSPHLSNLCDLHSVEFCSVENLWPLLTQNHNLMCVIFHVLTLVVWMGGLVIAQMAWTPIPWFLQVLDGTPEGTFLTDSWWTAGSRGENNWARTLLSWEHLHPLLWCGNFFDVSYCLGAPLLFQWHLDGMWREDAVPGVWRGDRTVVGVVRDEGSMGGSARLWQDCNTPLLRASQGARAAEPLGKNR